MVLGETSLLQQFLNKKTTRHVVMRNIKYINGGGYWTRFVQTMKLLCFSPRRNTLLQTLEALNDIVTGERMNLNLHEDTTFLGEREQNP